VAVSFRPRLPTKLTKDGGQVCSPKQGKKNDPWSGGHFSEKQS
jgi:hypothetical protein